MTFLCALFSTTTPPPPNCCNKHSVTIVVINFTHVLQIAEMWMLQWTYIYLSLSLHTQRQWGGTATEALEEHFFEPWGTLQVLCSFKSSFPLPAVSCVDSCFVWIIEVWRRGRLLGKMEEENSLKPIGVHSVNTTVKEKPILKTWDVLISSEGSERWLLQ